MGARDPDFDDPAEEAAWIGRRLGAEVVTVPEAGHYPQAQRPELVAGTITGFVTTGGEDGQGRVQP